MAVATKPTGPAVTTHRLPCVDRDGVVLEPGQRVRVQQCVGRYGQTRITEGEFLYVDPWTNVYIRLGPGQSFTEWFDRPLWDGTSYVPSKQYRTGDTYLAGSLTYDREHGVLRGYNKFDDYEHGHETWVEVMD